VLVCVVERLQKTNREDATPTRAGTSRQNRNWTETDWQFPRAKQRESTGQESKDVPLHSRDQSRDQPAERRDQTAEREREREREREQTEALSRASVATFLAHSLLFVLTLAGLFSLSLLALSRRAV
jgi:hypothetical protein